ncbi:unnamed protein product [Rotaria sordida]|uniref:EGF-like domain-containing protein n=1 Tax=Rotaria sordida TaxID=392033 RepID=A0A814G516_9BILA|nr:unnamed protein product [Rotaria sordida]
MDLGIYKITTVHISPRNCDKFPIIVPTWFLSQWANGGICQPAEGSTLGYKCRCQFGFTGTLCESRLNITTCVRNPCLHNGNCTVTNDYQVKCTCPKGYTGARCEISI